MTARRRCAVAVAALLGVIAAALLLVPARGAHLEVTRLSAPAAGDPDVRADITLCLLLCTPTPQPVPTTPPQITINPPSPITLPPTATAAPSPGATTTSTDTTGGTGTGTSTTTTATGPFGPFLTPTPAGSTSAAAGDTLNTAAPANVTPPGDAFGASGIVTVVVTILVLTGLGALVLLWRLR